MADAIKEGQNKGSSELLLIDDHPLFCDAMAMMVAEIFKQPKITTAATLTQAMEAMDGGLLPDLVVLDLNLPDVDGIDGLMRLRARAPQMNVVVVSSLSDNQVIASVIDAGARGFIPKDASREVLVEAFQTILEGDIFTPKDFYKPQNSRLNQERVVVMEKIKSLTPQQVTILGLICEGKLNKQIAYELSIAETTVKAHLTAILRKMGVQNRTQAVLLAKKVSFTSLSSEVS